MEFTPRELLTGHVINTITMAEEITTTEPTREDVETQMSYTRQQQLDTYSHVVEHTNEREAVFNKNIDKSRLKKMVIFCTNNLVQVYRSDLDYTFRTTRKMLPKWGQVRRVVSRDINSYQLASLEGLMLKGRFSARRLHKFEARPGTSLDDQQKVLAAATTLLRNAGTWSRDEADDVPEEGVSEEEGTLGREQNDKGDTECGIDDEEGLESPQGGEEGNARTNGDNGEIQEHGEEDRDEEPLQDGWTAPGRLRVRKGSGAQKGANRS